MFKPLQAVQVLFMTKILIPGKLFLAGEYAITHPGNTALIATTKTGLSVEIESAAQTSVIHSNTITTDWHFNITETAIVSTDDWRYVRAAVNIMQAYTTTNQFKPLSNINVNITSNLNSPFGKIGLGSSAAVVVGIVEAINAQFNLKLPILTRFKLASLAHLHVQKNGSLGDIAAIMYGGVIAYQSPDLSSFKQNDENWLRPSLANKIWPKLHIAQLPWPPKWQLLLGATLESADTKSALEHFILSKQFITESQQIVQNLIHTIAQEDYPQLALGLRRNQELLQNSLPTGYITPKLAHLLESLTNIAGKISGAGFGDNGFAVLQNNAEQLESVWQRYQIVAQPIIISPQKRG